MDLTPQSLHAVEFREARRGGYNTRDVDDFIERVAGGVGHLNERVRDAAGARRGRRRPDRRPPARARRGPPPSGRPRGVRDRRDAAAHAGTGPTHRRRHHQGGEGRGEPRAQRGAGGGGPHSGRGRGRGPPGRRQRPSQRPGRGRDAARQPRQAQVRPRRADPPDRRPAQPAPLRRQRDAAPTRRSLGAQAAAAAVAGRRRPARPAHPAAPGRRAGGRAERQRQRAAWRSRRALRRDRAARGAGPAAGRPRSADPAGAVRPVGRHPRRLAPVRAAIARRRAAGPTAGPPGTRHRLAAPTWRPIPAAAPASGAGPCSIPSRPTASTHASAAAAESARPRRGPPRLIGEAMGSVCRRARRQFRMWNP